MNSYLTKTNLQEKTHGETPHFIVLSDSKNAKAFTEITGFTNVVFTDFNDIQRVSRDLTGYLMSIGRNNENSDILKMSGNSQKTNGVKISNDIANILNKLCITPNYNGYNYLKEAFKIIVENNNPCMIVSKELYPEIAERLNVTKSGIERSIRTAIARAWQKVSDFDKLDIFGGYALKADYVPTNSEFISIIGERLCENI